MKNIIVLYLHFALTKAACSLVIHVRRKNIYKIFKRFKTVHYYYLTAVDAIWITSSSMKENGSTYMRQFRNVCLPMQSVQAKCWHSGYTRSCLSCSLQIGHWNSSCTSCACFLITLRLLLTGMLKCDVLIDFYYHCHKIIVHLHKVILYM